MAGKKRTVRRLDARELRDYALNLLGRRAMSAGEIRTKLRRRAADPESVEPVLEQLREYGYLDDQKFAEAYSAARRDSGNFGKARVIRDLRQRRVGGTLAETAAGQAFSDIDEVQLVTQWLERKLRSRNIAEYLQDEKNLASTYRKLRYAGFSSSASIRALKQHSIQADELPGTEGDEAE